MHEHGVKGKATEGNWKTLHKNINDHTIPYIMLQLIDVISAINLLRTYCLLLEFNANQDNRQDFSDSRR
jgi:hypothetical protein